MQSKHKAIAGVDMRKTIGFQLYVQQALGTILFRHGFNKIDRPRLELTLIGLDSEPHPRPGLFATLFSQFNWVRITRVQSQPQFPCDRIGFNNIALRKTQRVAIENKPAHRDLLTLADR